MKHGPKHGGVKQEIMAWWGRGGCQEPPAWRGQKSEVIRKIRDQRGGRGGRILGGQRLACVEVDGESMMCEQVFGLSILGKFISLVSVFSRKLRPAFLCWHLCKARAPQPCPYLGVFLQSTVVQWSKAVALTPSLEFCSR